MISTYFNKLIICANREAGGSATGTAGIGLTDRLQAEYLRIDAHVELPAFRLQSQDAPQVDVQNQQGWCLRAHLHKARCGASLGVWHDLQASSDCISKERHHQERDPRLDLP